MDKLVSNIVFTKNRPLQLHAYLESLYRYLPAGLIQTYIIYKAELFGREYEQLFGEFPGCVVVTEGDFHSDFLRVLGRCDTKYILFGVDDVVYFDGVDFELVDRTFTDYAADIFGFTMRFSPESLGADESITKLTVAGREVYRLNWKKGRTPHARYPFELCSTVYTTELVRKIVNGTMNTNPLAGKLFSPSSALVKALGEGPWRRSILKKFGFFFSPNTLESWNCRWCREHPDLLPDFTYFQRLCASAVQVNMVNTTTKNTFDGSDETTVEALGAKYKQGYRLDIDFVAANRPTGPSCGLSHFRLVKK